MLLLFYYFVISFGFESLGFILLGFGVVVMPALVPRGMLVGRVLVLVVVHLLVEAHFLVDTVPVFEVVQAIARRQ